MTPVVRFPRFRVWFYTRLGLGLALRHAEADDAARLFRWRNDPETRRQSHTTEPVAWDAHVAWLARVLGDPRRRLYLAEVGDVAVGTGRLDDLGDALEVSLTVAPEWRGRGFAVQIIRALADEASGRPLYAEVKVDNARSLRAFLGAGFQTHHVAHGVAHLQRAHDVTGQSGS